MMKRNTLYTLCFVLLLVTALPAYGSLFKPLRSSNQRIMSGVIETMPSGADIVTVNPSGMMWLEPGKYVSLTLMITYNQFEWNGCMNKEEEFEHLSCAERRDGVEETLTVLDTGTIDELLAGNIPSGELKNVQKVWHAPDPNFAAKRFTEKSVTQIGPLPLFQYANVKEDSAWGFTLMTPGGPLKWENDWAGKEIVMYADMWVFGFNFNFAYRLNEDWAIAAGITPNVGNTKSRNSGANVNVNNKRFWDTLKVFLVDDVVGQIGGSVLAIGVDAIADQLLGALVTILPDTPITPFTADSIFYGWTQKPWENMNYNVSASGQILDNYFLALNHTTELPLEFQGELKSNIHPSVQGALEVLDIAFEQLGIPPLDIALPNQPAFLSVTFPSISSLAFGWKDDPEFPKYELEFGYSLIGFSVFKEQGVELTECSLAVVMMGFEKCKVGQTFNLKDVNEYRIGGQYHWSEKYIFKGAIAHATSAAPDEFLAPNAPLLGTYEGGGGVDYMLSDDEIVTLGVFFIYLIPQDSTGKVNEEKGKKADVSGVFHPPFEGEISGITAGIALQYNVTLDELCKCEI